MEKIDFLPTKIKYNSYRQCIDMWYRLSNSFKLYKTSVPFDYYIYLTLNHRKSIDTSNLYHHIRTGEVLTKTYISPKEAYEIVNSGAVTGEGDVSPEQRFVCDEFCSIEFPAEIKPRLFYLDIETYVTDNKFPKFNHNISEISAITIYDNYTKEFYTWGLIPDNWNQTLNSTEDEILDNTKEYGKVNLYLFNKPKDLLMSFIQFIKQNTPDIITAWNAPFDIPYITRKIYDYFDYEGLKSISPFNYVSSKVKKAIEFNLDLDRDTLIPGIDVIDMLALYKKYSNVEKPSYALDAIAEDELGEHKIKDDDSDTTDLVKLYNEQFIKFIKYNINDVRLMVGIEHKSKIFELAIAVRNYTKVNYQDIFHETMTIDNLFIMEAVRRRNKGNWNYVLPSKDSDILKKKFTGAYVKPPIKGLFKWLGDLKQN